MFLSNEPMLVNCVVLLLLWLYSSACIGSLYFSGGNTVHHCVSCTQSAHVNLYNLCMYCSGMRLMIIAQGERIPSVLAMQLSKLKPPFLPFKATIVQFYSLLQD